MPPCSFTHLLLYFLRLGATGFGGPVALVNYMHRDLIEDRQWFSEAQYREGLALSQLAPGPIATQLAIYFGFLHSRILGATFVGIAFVLPAFVIVVGLAIAYTMYGGLSWVQSVFYGVGAAIVGVMAESAWHLSRKTISKEKLLWGIFFIAALLTAVLEFESVWLFIGAGLLVAIVRTRPHFPLKRTKLFSFVPLSLGALLVGSPAASGKTLFDMLLFFTKTGAFVFGSGLVIVPFLYGGVVHGHQWLTDKVFLDAVAVGMITPGPVVITVGFVGFLIAGFAGASIASFGIFFPCYLCTVVFAFHFQKIAKKPAVVAFVDGITAAATGAISGAVIILARKALIDMPTLFIALASAGVLFWKKIPVPLLVVAAALAGFAIKG